MLILKLKAQLSRNSQVLNLLDVDHPTPSPEPPIRSSNRSLSTDLARTRSRLDSETGNQTWSSPAFLKRNQLPYATYLNTQYDPFRDESIFEDGERRKKMRLGRKSYQWTFANTKSSPDKEDRLGAYESSRSTSPDLVEEANDGTSSTATLQSGSTEQKEASANKIGLDENLPQRNEDEAMLDEVARETLTGHDPQASFDVDTNGHILLNDEVLPGVAILKQPDRDLDSESSIKLGPERQELRPKPSEFNIHDEDMSQILAEDRQSTPTRRVSPIIQESSQNDTTSNSPDGDPVTRPPMTEDLYRQEALSESSETNVQNQDASQILVEGRQSTPSPRDSSIRREFPLNDSTHDLLNEDSMSRPPITQPLDSQELPSESSEDNMQKENESQVLAEDRQRSSLRKSPSVKGSSPSHAMCESLDRDPDDEPSTPEGLDSQEARPEKSDADMKNIESSQILPKGRQSSSVSRDSSISRDSLSNGARYKLAEQITEDENLPGKGNGSRELHTTTENDIIETDLTSPVPPEDRPDSPATESSSANRDSGLEGAKIEKGPRLKLSQPKRQVSPSESPESLASTDSPDRDPDDEPSTASLDRLEFHLDKSDADMEDVESAQILPKGRPFSSTSRDSSLVRQSLSNGTRYKLPEHIIDDDNLPEKCGVSQKLHIATAKDEDDLAPEVLPEDRPDPSGIEASSAGLDSPLEDVEIEKSPRLQPLQPQRRFSPPESPEFLAPTDSTSQVSVAESQASLEEISEDDSRSGRESINDFSEAISTVSPSQSPYADLEDLPDYQSSNDIESEDEVIYVDFGFSSPCEESSDSRISSSSSEASGQSNVTTEGVHDDKHDFELDGLPISLVHSTIDDIPLSCHKREDVPKEQENTFSPIATSANDMEKLNHEVLAADEANSASLDIMNTDNIFPDDEIAKAKEENRRQDMKSMTFHGDHATEIYRDSDPIDIDDEPSKDQKIDRVCEDVSAAGSGEDDETDEEAKIAAQPKSTSNTSNTSPDQNRKIEKDISTRGGDFAIISDDTYSPAQRNNESQLARAKPTVDIIDLESEEVDNIASRSPQIKEDPSQAPVGFGNTDDVISEERHVSKQDYELSRSEKRSEDKVGKKPDADQAIHEGPGTGTTFKGGEQNLDSRTEQLSSRDAPSKDTSERMKTALDREHDPGVQHQDQGASSQSSTSALEEALLGDTNFDPILRSQLFTPLSSQQRSLKSEQSIVSEKNKQVEHELPTPHLTQSTSAPLLPPTTPERHETPTLVERIKAMKSLSARKAHARSSIDYSKAASNWFTRRKPSQLTHVSDSEGERESNLSSDQVSIVDEEPPGLEPPLESSGPSILSDKTSQTESIDSKSPPIKGLRTSFAYYAPLSSLHFGTPTSVLTVLHSVDPIARSKFGPRDFYRFLFLSDPSSMQNPPTIAKIFRPKQLALPNVNPGDAILLRNFKVQSFEKSLGLLSTDSSGWAVFRKGVEVEVRGPPVEFGPEERCFIKGLWKWWESVGVASVEKAIAEAAKKGTTERARSVEGGFEGEVDQRSKGKTDQGISSTPRGAKGKVSGRTRSLVESDMTPTTDSGRHELRDGTSYPDSTPERRAMSGSGAVVHELRDGTTYTDTDMDTDADGEKKVEGKEKTKRGASAEKDGRRVERGLKIEKGEHELRDGTRYSDGFE